MFDHLKSQFTNGYGNKLYNTFLKQSNMKKEIMSTERETYITPDIEVVDIEIEQNILQEGSGDAPDFAPEYW